MGIEQLRAIKNGTYSRSSTEKKTVGIPRERPVKEEKKRKPLPKATKPIAKRSDKMKSVMKELKKLYPLFLKKFPVCAIDAPGCSKIASCIHHTKGRGPKEVLDTRTWMASCLSCNNWVEGNHAEAEKRGFKISRHKKDTMTKEEIVQSTSKKHVKIYKLSQLGLPKKEIAELVGTNAGHVFNVLKDYSMKPEKAAAADQA